MYRDPVKDLLTRITEASDKEKAVKDINQRIANSNIKWTDKHYLSTHWESTEKILYVFIFENTRTYTHSNDKLVFKTQYNGRFIKNFVSILEEILHKDFNNKKKLA